MSQLIDRLVVSRGPALVVFNGGSFLSREDIVVDLSKETNEIPSDAYGPLTEATLGVKASLKFRPVGEFEHLDVLFPYAETVIGSSIFGDADVPLIIKPLDADQDMVTFHAAAVSQMPNLQFTAKDILFAGDAGFQMVGKNNTAVDNANRLFTFAANDIGAVPYDPDLLIAQAYQNRWLSDGTFTLTYGGDTTAALDWDSTAGEVEAALDALASIIAAGGVGVTGNVNDGWTVTFTANGARTAITGTVTDMPGGTTVKATVLTEGSGGAAEVVYLRLNPWNGFQAREGVNVNFDLSITEDETDAIGHYDSVFSGLKVTATAQPQGVSAAEMLAAAAVQGTRSVRGTRLSVGAHHLDIFATGVYFRLYAANIKSSGLVYSSKNQRIPEITWASSRAIGDGGAVSPLFFIGDAAP